jgi:NADH-quinone oxidoreductase subunit N
MDLLAKNVTLNLFENHFNLILPELFLGIIGMLLLVYGVLLGTRKSILTKNIIWLVVQTMFISILLIQNNNFGCWSIFNGTLKIDGIGCVVKIIVLISSISCLLISLDYVKRNNMNLFEYPLLILLSVLGMLFLISSLDLISLYLAIELQSLCFYVLAGLKRGSSFSTEASLKYFILGAFSSGLLLFGSSLIYGFSGTTNFEEISRLFLCVTNFYSLHTLGIISGLIFVTSALLFKVGAFPFHMWLPDVYEGISTPITVFFSAVPKVVLLGLFIRLYGSIFSDMIYA